MSSSDYFLALARLLCPFLALVSPVHFSMVIRNKINIDSMVQLLAARKLYGRLVKLGTWVFYLTFFAVMGLRCAFIRSLI